MMRIRDGLLSFAYAVLVVALVVTALSVALPGAAVADSGGGGWDTGGTTCTITYDPPCSGNCIPGSTFTGSACALVAGGCVCQ
jgi:hypothetical protein